MNNPLFSTAYLPPIEYFAHMINHKSAYVDLLETYPKQTYRNRCNIFTEKGFTTLSIPVKKPNGNHTKTKDILISDDIKWKNNHWRAIESAYMASPFFMYYSDEIKDVFFKEENRLWKFNLNLFNLISQLAEIDCKIEFTSDFVLPQKGENDFRYSINPKQKSRLNFPEYIQVFSDRHGFIPNLSILDLLFNIGTETSSYLKNVQKAQL